MPMAPVNGIDLFYESHGNGPAVVFAHGVGGNHLIWWQQVPVLSKKYQCITFDHRGFGLSHDSLDGPGGYAYVEDLKALLDHIGVEKTFLVGQSMGGIATLGFAVKYPERTLGLVLAGTTGAMGDKKIVDMLNDYVPPEDPAVRFSAPAFRENHPVRTFLFLATSRINPPRNPRATTIFRTGEGPKADDVASMNVPTLLISGKHDVVMPTRIVAEVQKLIPGSRMEVLADCGHSTYFEHPEIFNRLISEFFSEVLLTNPIAASQD